MSAPQGILEGRYVTRPLYFNGQHYSWWKNQIENYIQAEDYELWMLIVNGPYIPVKVTTNGKTFPKESNEFNSDDFRKMQKNAKTKKLLYFRLRPDEYTHISECVSAKETWNTL